MNCCWLTEMNWKLVKKYSKIVQKFVKDTQKLTQKLSRKLVFLKSIFFANFGSICISNSSMKSVNPSERSIQLHFISFHLILFKQTRNVIWNNADGKHSSSFLKNQPKNCQKNNQKLAKKSTKKIWL